MLNWVWFSYFHYLNKQQKGGRGSRERAYIRPDPGHHHKSDISECAAAAVVVAVVVIPLLRCQFRSNLLVNLAPSS